jgi:hypothetical protein
VRVDLADQFRCDTGQQFAKLSQTDRPNHHQVYVAARFTVVASGFACTMTLRCRLKFLLRACIYRIRSAFLSSRPGTSYWVYVAAGRLVSGLAWKTRMAKSFLTVLISVT